MSKPRMISSIRLLLVVSITALAVLFSACGSNSGGGSTTDAAAGDTVSTDTASDDTGVEDTTTTDSGAADGGVTDSAQGDTKTIDGGSDPDAGGAGAFGFNVRTPVKITLSCPSPMGQGTVSTEFIQNDWICTFKHEAVEGYVYIRATPAKCVSFGLSSAPIYDAKGWFSTNGNVTALEAASYDWGGNHHNDFLGFKLGGKRYKANHSSFGYGWRKCQPMDCLQVVDGAGKMLEDGCTKDRTLPIVCRQVKDKSFADEMKDTFKKCPGDPDA